MKIIIPCGGKSSRFPNVRPKWMLNSPNGDLMVISAIRGLKFDLQAEIIITILKEHEEKYSIVDGIKKNFQKYYNNKLTILQLEEPTKSQSETVYETIVKLNINDSILVKDSDNYFEIEKVFEDTNYIIFEELSNYENINAKNKSYIRKDRNNIIREIREKQIISEEFSIGGYFFQDSLEFKKYFEILNSRVSNNEKGIGEIYLSNVIEFMISENKIFVGKKAKNYKDWGTLKDWLAYKENIKTYFIDIDGVLFKNGAQYFEPYWGTTEPILENIQIIKELKKQGNYIIITTSRSEEYRKITEKQFLEYEIPYDQLIMGIGNGKRIIINDFSNSNPFPACSAINIERNKGELKNFLILDKN